MLSYTGLLFFGTIVNALIQSSAGPSGSMLPLPPGGPQPPPAYMVDNVNNQFGVAPDKNVLTGPVTSPLDLTTLKLIHKHNPDLISTYNVTTSTNHTQALFARQTADNYWLSSMTHGQMPFAPSGYKFYRNVKDYGAKGDGVTDDTAAINKAVTDGNRCGANCGSTTVTGALVYFPPGTYKISTPIIQYYYTQFVGNPNNRPTIKGASNFSGIALVDSDYYIPGGNGNEWYINQSNFYRQVRNIIFDLTTMARTNMQGDQQYVPTGIHWQVGQATSITNCHFQMAVSDANGPATAVGIFMENGSGGFASDLTFFGGNIGFRAGSQQFTARNLQFTSCLTAISQIWNWGFTWQNIYCNSVYVAIDCTAHGGSTGQGTGSISVVDSHFVNVPYAIPISNDGIQPNIVIDNLLIENTPSVVLVSGGKTLLPGSSSAITITQWAMGLQYKNIDGTGSYATGFVTPTPDRPDGLLLQGKYFTRSKPQYENVGAGNIVVATANGVSNANTGDQTSAINTLLASHIGSVIFFPAGVYLVKGTVKVPVGSKIIGEGWSQIMAFGPYFQDASQPKVMVQVGNPGDKGVVEITDMLFTVRGPTAGCILMEWNVHESSQGSAGMWDSHFRVGGAAGSNLQLGDCPTGSSVPNPKCQAASMLLHVTNKASGYFENVWAWVADHDLDNPNNAKITEGTDGIPNNVQTNVNIYSARGVLIESQGPSWFVGTASEHSQFYQYQIAGARNIYLGHMQTETPYYQPSPIATLPFKPNKLFPQDPVFLDCAEPYCNEAWALRILNSQDIFIYSAGFYSFFSGNSLGCVGQRNCQERLVETNFASGIWLYNLFTVGNTEIISPRGGITPIFFNDTTQRGYTSEVALWLVLALQGFFTGTLLNDTSAGSGVVYIDPTIWQLPPASRTVQCYPPCIFVFPPEILTTTTTITFPPYTTSLEVGWTTTITDPDVHTTSIGFTSIIETTTLTIPPYTGTTIDFWNTLITSGVNSTLITITSSILPPPITVTNDPNPLHQTSTTRPTSTVTRTVPVPPFPYTTPRPTPGPPPGTSGPPPPVTFKTGPPSPSCRGSHCGHRCRSYCINPCSTACPPGVYGGGGAGGFPDPSDPNNPDDNSSECTTSTYSSCVTECTATPSTCSSTCSPVVGCDTMGDDVDSTVTPAPVQIGFGEQWGSSTANAAQLASGASAQLVFLSGIGDYSTTPPSGTTTKTTTSSPPATSSKSTAPPGPTETTCLLTGFTDGSLGFCTPGGKCGGGSFIAGFSLSYLNGPFLGYSEQDDGGTKPATNTEVTIPKWELGNPTDLQWEANYDVSFSNCHVNDQYRGTPADGSFCKDNNLDSSICEECSVKFPCPSNLVPFYKHNCTVSAKYRDSWVESALSRYRTVFRASNMDAVATYCNFWYTCGLFINPQCGFDSQVDGGTWRVDVSTVQGPAGQEAYDLCLASTLNKWSSYQNCRIVDF